MELTTRILRDDVRDLIHLLVARKDGLSAARSMFMADHGHRAFDEIEAEVLRVRRIRSSAQRVAASFGIKDTDTIDVESEVAAHVLRTMPHLTRYEGLSESLSELIDATCFGDARRVADIRERMGFQGDQTFLDLFDAVALRCQRSSLDYDVLARILARCFSDGPSEPIRRTE